MKSETEGIENKNIDKKFVNLNKKEKC